MHSSPEDVKCARLSTAPRSLKSPELSELCRVAPVRLAGWGGYFLASPPKKSACTFHDHLHLEKKDK
jgi:hypothetical protein